MRKQTVPKERTFKMQGFSRVQLKRNGEVVGDSGWVGPNVITNTGVQNFVMGLIGAQAGSSQVGAMAVGTGGYPASTATALANEYGGSAVRCPVTVGTTQRTASNATATLQFTGSWASSKNTANSTINNVGLYDISTGAGNLFAGNTYATSQWSNNQDLYATYQILCAFGT